MSESIASFEELQRVAREADAVVFYLNTNSCNVGASVRPQLERLLGERFPRLPLRDVDMTAASDVAGQWGVHDVPAVVIYFDGRETARFVRHFGLGEIEAALERPYGLFFGA